MGSEHTNDEPEARAPVPRVVFEGRGRGAARWRAALAGVELEAGAPTRSSELVLDSFDRRLQRGGWLLSVRGRAPRVRCRLTGGASGPRTEEFVLRRVPGFVWDLPAPHAERLLDVLEMRGLDTLATHETGLTRWAVLDAERKTVARIEEELHRVRPAAGEARWLPARRRVLVQGVRGYDAELARIAAALDGVPDLVRVEDRPFDPRVCLGDAPPRAGGWPRLAPDVSARDGLAAVVRAQLEVVAACAEGLRADRDGEFLHDTRVALRRVRSLVSQLRGVLPPEEHERLGGELRWLARSTGRARDLDTLILELRLAEPDSADALAPAVRALVAERRREQRRIVAAFDSPRARELLAHLGRVFAEGGASGPSGPRASRPFARVLAKRLERRLRQVARGAREAGEESPATELHELRISAKKLRYLLECCRVFLPRAELAGCARHLKALQSALGKVQDVEVQGELVREVATQHVPETGTETLLALGRFLERIEDQGRRARGRFRRLADEFLSPESRAGFEALVRRLRHLEEAP